MQVSVFNKDAILKHMDKKKDRNFNNIQKKKDLKMGLAHNIISKEFRKTQHIMFG